MGITFELFKLFRRCPQKTIFSSVIECVYVALVSMLIAAQLEISYDTQFEKYCLKPTKNLHHHLQMLIKTDGEQ